MSVTLSSPIEVEEERESEGGQQFFFDQKSLDIAERKRRQQQGIARQTGKRGRLGTRA